MATQSTSAPELAGAMMLLLQRAARTGAVHRVDVDGWCAGCADEGHILFHPCSYARWAEIIERRYAVRRVDGGEA